VTFRLADDPDHDVAPEVEAIGRNVLDAAFEVHKALGPGMLESAYATCLGFALLDKGLRVEREVWVPITFAGRTIEAAYRVDLLVEDQVIVEAKAVESVLGVHQAQLVTYLRLTGLSLGFLLNFNVPWMKAGIHRMVHPRHLRRWARLRRLRRFGLRVERWLTRTCTAARRARGRSRRSAARTGRSCPR
jgi:GxxExxY protein